MSYFLQLNYPSPLYIKCFPNKLYMAFSIHATFLEQSIMPYFLTTGTVKITTPMHNIVISSPFKVIVSRPPILMEFFCSLLRPQCLDQTGSRVEWTVFAQCVDHLSPEMLQSDVTVKNVTTKQSKLPECAGTKAFGLSWIGHRHWRADWNNVLGNATWQFSKQAF